MPLRKRSVAADPPATTKSPADPIPPIPQNIESLVRPAMKRRAGILWRDCWMLRAAVDGQLNWYRRLRDTGTADGGTYRLEETKALCLGPLRPFIESLRPGLLDEPGFGFPIPDGLDGWQAATLREYHDRNCTMTLQGLYGVAGNIAKALNHDAETFLLPWMPHYRSEANGQGSGEPQVNTLSGGGGAVEELQKTVASLVRQQKKHTKPLTPTEKNRNQRIKFCCPRRSKNPQDTWNEIYHDYAEKYPNDKTASPDSLLHSHDRNCLKCRELKS